jgi:serine/threonine-protein kinase RsbW
MAEPGHNGHCEVIIASDHAAARRVQDDIEAALRACQFEEREVFSIKLALEEALVNAIKHGNQMDQSKKIHISYCVSLECFEVKIADEGPGFDPDDVPDPMAPENLERPCGRGLLLMRHYMTEVIYHAPGNRLSMTKVRTSPSQT